MNIIVIGVLLLLLFTYCGGSSVPTLLKDNKKYLLGFAVGVIGYPLMRIEGLDMNHENWYGGKPITNFVTDEMEDANRWVVGAGDRILPPSPPGGCGTACKNQLAL